MFTPGVEKLTHWLRPTRRSGRVVFPPGLPEGAARRKKQEPAHRWISHCIAEAGGAPQLAIEDNLALLLVLHVDGRQLRYANLQALWSEVSIAAFAAGDGTETHRYLRLDYDPSALGSLLKEPMPHLHVEADGEPRFPLARGAASDPIGWFIDLVYRNYFYDEWIAWAEGVWDAWCSETGRPNRWVRLVQAFKQSNMRLIEVDRDLRDDLLQLKRRVLLERQKFFSFEVDSAQIELFGHDVPT